MKESVFETLTLMGCSKIHQQMTRNQWEEKNKKEERAEERKEKKQQRQFHHLVNSIYEDWLISLSLSGSTQNQ